MKENQKKAVVPCISASSSLACIRSLGRRGVDTIAITDQKITPEKHSKYCTESLKVPSPREDLAAYRDVLLELAAKPEVGSIFPVRPSDSYVLANNTAEFTRHISQTWPLWDTYTTVYDRMELLETAKREDLNIPRTKLFSKWDNWDQPAIIKSRYVLLESDGKATYPDVEYVTVGEQPDQREIINRMNHEPLVQEYIKGGEFGFFALVESGSPVATFQHRRIRSNSYAGGASVYRESVDIPELDRLGRLFLKSLDWHGPAMVEFKRDAQTGEFFLMEVNPRFWGSLALPISAGVDFPYLYHQLAVGELGDEVTNYETGIGSQRLLMELRYLLSIIFADYPDYVDKPSLAHAIKDVVRTTSTSHFDYLSTDDTKPFIWNIVQKLYLIQNL